MTNDTHDVDLTMHIDGVAHGLAVYGKAFISLPIGFVPALKRPIKMRRIDADEDITDDGLTGNDPPAVFHTAAEALPGLLR